MEWRDLPPSVLLDVPGMLGENAAAFLKAPPWLARSRLPGCYGRGRMA
jgi:hypothetical protein